MKIIRKAALTLQIYDGDFPGQSAQRMWWGAPSSDAWWKMMVWAQKNGIVCRRGRGTDMIFEREQDVTAFVLRWS